MTRLQNTLTGTATGPSDGSVEAKRRLERSAWMGMCRVDSDPPRSHWLLRRPVGASLCARTKHRNEIRQTGDRQHPVIFDRSNMVHRFNRNTLIPVQINHVPRSTSRHCCTVCRCGRNRPGPESQAHDDPTSITIRARRRRPMTRDTDRATESH